LTKPLLSYKGLCAMELVMYIEITVTEEILLRGYNQETYLTL